jgi:ABC-type phosphate transport system substrate-binding protein
MMSLSARRFMPACALSVAAVAALVTPGAASAAGKLGVQCSGTNITGEGSSLQKLAQQTVWGPDFNISKNGKACSGTQGSTGKPTATYTSVGSGAGMEAWGLNGHAFEGTNGFVGTDEPPSQAQTEEIETHAKEAKSNTLETIPVLQGAVAIIVRLPNNCQGTSTVSPGRLVLDNVTLQKIWNGEITEWSSLHEGGDELINIPGNKVNCNPATAINRVVRKDQSGTTAIFKKYLGLINPEKNIVGELGWGELVGTHSTEWPGTVLKPTETGGGALVSLVSNTASSIGYANLADVRSNGTFAGPTGGSKTKRFWVEIQNNGLEQEEETYSDPSTNGDTKTVANSNCANTEYTNGEVPFPPASTLEPWNEVTTSTAETNYTLCGLTYDLTFREYSKYPGTTLEQATTVNNYINWVLATGTEGGQVEIKNHDYLGLPTALQTIANTGASSTKF